MNRKYRLSENQYKLFRHYQFFPNDTSYNLAFLYKITGPLDPTRLKQAIETVYNAIDQLKIDFEEKENEILQNFIQNRTYEVEMIHRKPNQSPAQFRIYVDNDAHKRLKAPIDLCRWPLLRFTLYLSQSEENFLFVYAPHIISDGLSYTHLIDKITKTYKFKLDRLEQLPIQYPNSSWLSKSLEFFNQEFSSVDSFELKAIKQNRDSQNLLEGNIQYVKIPKEPLLSFLSQHKYSESSFFLALHVLFLKKISDENQIVIGLPVLNRNKEHKNAFGYFVNTLPLKVDFTEIHTFAELIEVVNKKILRLLRHQSFDLSQLKSIDSKFTSYFTYYAQEFNYAIENCHFQRIYLRRESIGSEFTLTVENREENWMLGIESGIFFQSVDIPKVLQTIIHSVMITPLCLLKKIPLIEDSEKARYPAPSGPKASITHAFAHIAQLYPQQVALNDFSSLMTYKELDQKSNQIARFLQQKASDSKYVIISPDRTSNLIVLILGILKAKKCYVPIDKFCPRERFQYIADKLETSMIIGSLDVQSKYQILSNHFIVMDELLREACLFSKAPLEEFSLENDLAYIIFTSGTTGKPKGVQVSHLNLMSLIYACFQKFIFGPQDIWTLFHSYSFDFSVWEIFGCLLSGGTLLVIDREVAKIPTSFYSILSNYQVTVLNQTPTSFKELIRVDLLERKQLNLKYIIFGGEALSFPNLKEWTERHPLATTKLINMYGITETTIHTTYYEIQPEDLHHPHSIIGKSLPHLTVQIVNCEGQKLPAGIMGEIAIGGEGVSCGYYQAPELTDKKFVLKNGERFYLSGDLGKLNANQDIVFLGRKDRQVQVRGFRVELDEIEFHILQTKLVKQCAIDAIELPNDSQLRIIAYVIPNSSFSEREIKEHLATSLPFYMIPSFFCSVFHIPLTINGKIDFASLRTQHKWDQSKQPKATTIEAQLYQIISHTIKKSDFSLTDNFWEIGVTSIDIASLFFQIKTQFAIHFSMAAFFQYTTIAKLADFIGKQTQHMDNKHAIG